MMKHFLIILIFLFISVTAFAEGVIGVKPFIPKESNDLPDNYGIKIIYVTGKEETFELAFHKFSKETGLFEFVTKDDLWNWIPLSSVVRIEFDKRFSQMMSLKEKQLQEKETNKKE